MKKFLEHINFIKCLWHLRHQPKVFASASSFFDLPDWLVHKATGSHVRSLCSLVCKWNYRAGEDAKELDGWDWAFLKQIGLGDLTKEQLGSKVVPPGSPVADGLTEKAAQELGLKGGTKVGWSKLTKIKRKTKDHMKVGASLIDAHAGALGMLASPSGKQGEVETF